ncbi:MAG TPA: hypothetical protein VGJ09_03560, partial [Bryobacteraceae bacterium]
MLKFELRVVACAVNDLRHGEASSLVTKSWSRFDPKQARDTGRFVLAKLIKCLSLRSNSGAAMAAVNTPPASMCPAARGFRPLCPHAAGIKEIRQVGAQKQRGGGRYRDAFTMKAMHKKEAIKPPL